MTIWFGKYIALDIFGAIGMWSFHWNQAWRNSDSNGPTRNFNTWAFGPIWLTRYARSVTR